MIRLFLRLIGIKDFDTCKSCETLKDQLLYEREEKQKLTNTLLDIIKPKAVEATPIELNQISQSSALFSRRRASLEEKDRQEAKILREKKHLGMPDKVVTSSRPTSVIKSAEEIEQLENELGIEKEA